MKKKITTLIFLLTCFTFCYSQRQVINGRQVFFGHLHNHSNVSDGTSTPTEAYSYAKSTAKLDFFGLADHCYGLSQTEWAAVKSAANAYNQDGVFTAFWGFEWSHNNYGHVAVINTDDYCTAGSEATNTFTEMVNWLSTRNGVAFFNHPGRQDGTHIEFNHFNIAPSDKFVGMELWNKDEGFSSYYYNNGYDLYDLNNGYYDEANLRGWKIGAAGSKDNHAATFSSSTKYRTAILADNLSRSALLAALKARRFYSTEDPNLALSFTADNNEMGSSLVEGWHTFRVQAKDGNSEVFRSIELIRNGSVIYTWNTSIRNVDVSISQYTDGGDYFYVRVKQVASSDPTDGSEAISSPIYFDFAGSNLKSLKASDPQISEVKDPLQSTNSLVSVFPNPCIDKITVLTKDENIKSLKLYSMHGVEQTCVIPDSGYSTDLNMSNFAKGIYILVIETDNGKYYKQVIKQ